MNTPAPNPTDQPTTWQLARLANRDDAPSAHLPGFLPGAVQRDWARAHGWPDLVAGQNVLAYAGLEDSFWRYGTTVPAVGPLPEGQALIFTCQGIDHHAELWIDGTLAGTATGLEAGWEIDVTHAQGRPLEILLHPAPKSRPAPADRSQADATTKPAVSYGWDWHPRLIPLGLAGPVAFSLRHRSRLLEVSLQTALADDFSQATLQVEVAASGPDRDFPWRLTDPEGRQVLAGRAGESAKLENPRLWWPHDHGAQALYTLHLDDPAPGASRWQKRIGFRRVRLVEAPGTWDHPRSFPKSRSLPPITLEINGRRIFAKGTNWVPPALFPAEITRATCEPLLQIARDTHFNLLRCWGGAAAPREDFFELCDELGLLVWQEFPLACNRYPDNPAYLAELQALAESLVRRARAHPCLAIWCGGNELFNGWSRMTDQSLPLRHLNRICLTLDPGTPFLPTVPIEGMGHGDYRWLDEQGRDVFAIFQQAQNTAYTEFGCPGPAPVHSLRSIIPANELWPPKPGGSWQTHHAFGAWEPENWLCLATLEKFFGPITTLEDLVAKSDWLQAEGYRSIYEEARRQWPQCSMALNWCFNEPWPCAANNSLVHWPAEPKPALKTVKAACRPSLASARIPKFQWKGGELFSAEIWLLNDSPCPLPGGELRASLEIDGQPIELLRWQFPSVSAQSHLVGPSVRCLLPNSPQAPEFHLSLEVPDQPSWNSRYRLSIAKQPAKSPTTESVTLQMNV